MRKFFKLIFSKFFIFSLILLTEIGILVFFVLFLNSTIHSAIFTGITIALDVIFVLYIINAEYKIAWIVPILFLPILGCLFYIIFGRKRLSRFTRKKLTRNFRGVECLYESRRGVLERFEETDEFFASCAKLISSEGYLPPTDCEEAFWNISS